MPLSNNTVDTWVTDNAASASGELTQTEFEQQLWLAVNGGRYRKQRKALEQISRAYPTLVPETVVSTLRAEVLGVAFP